MTDDNRSKSNGDLKGPIQRSGSGLTYVDKEHDEQREAPETAPEAPPAAHANRPSIPLWRLTARDRQHPPFHFANVDPGYIVAAHNERQARSIAAHAAAPHGHVWHDPEQTECEELQMATTGLVAALD